MKKLVFAVVAAVGALGAFGAAAITNWVAVTGTPQGDGSKANPFDLYTGYTNLNWRTGHVDALMIQPGTYHLSQIYPEGTTRMRMSQRNFRVRIYGTTGNPEDVVIDGDGSCGFFATSLSFDMQDIAFTNCYSEGKGGAIQCDAWSNGGKIGDGSTVSNCIFRCCRSALAGGGAYLRQAFVDNCLFENCTVTNLSEDKAHEYMAQGGGLDIQYNGGKVTRSIFRGCSVTCTVSGKACCGGGAYVGGDPAAETIGCWFEDCHVHGNASLENDGGGAVFATGVIRNSMITNCSSRIRYGAVGGSPKLVGCTVTGCKSKEYLLWRTPLTDTLVENNEVTNGAYIVHAVSWCHPSFYGDVFRRNKSLGQILGSGYSWDNEKTAVTISNCVFTLNEDNNSGNGGIIGISLTPTITVVDCIFSGEKPKTRGIFEVGLGTHTVAQGLTIRNCFFEKIQNDLCAYVYVNQSGTLPVKLENCTFIQKRNTQAVGFNGDASQEAFSAANCLFYSYNRKYFGKDYFATATSVTNSVFVWDNKNNTTAPTDINLDPSLGNNEYFYTAAGFKDPANGDYRLQRTSPLVDRSAQPDWAAYSDRKKGTTDMGDGTWTETPVAHVMACVGLAGVEKTFDVGVKVAHNKAAPRVVNKKIDVGCFEYYAAPGLLLLVK